MLRIILSLLLLLTLMPQSVFAQAKAGSGAKAPRRAHPMDANKDGGISLKEWTDAHTKRLEARFKELDADSNGSVTMQELRADRERRQKQRKQAAEKS